MKNINNIPYNLFAKFFSGEITEEEQVKLDEFIAENPENENIFHDYEFIWSSGSQTETFEAKTNEALKKVKSEFENESQSRKYNFKIIYRIAAAVIIVFGLTYFGKNLFFDNDPEYLTINTENETLQKELPDGSIVWLNKNSKLEYPKNFNADERRIMFSGEAFFKIAHNPNKPFIIESQGTETKVLGTEFNLRSVNSEEFIELTLIEGKVKFTDTKSKESKTLIKEETVKLNKNDRSLIKKKTLTKNHLYWKTKEINLDSLSLEDISTELNAIFNINITADSSVKELKYYQSLPFKNNDVDEILKIIEYTLNLKIDTLENTIILKR